MTEAKRKALARPAGSLQVGDFLIPQPYDYAMRVENISDDAMSGTPGYKRLAYTVFALTPERLPNLELIRSARIADSFCDIRPAIGYSWYRREDGQLYQNEEALPVYLKRVQLPGQLNLF